MARLASIEHKELSELQQKIHSFDCDSNTPITSPFAHGYRKTVWSSQTTKQLRMGAMSKKEDHCEAEFEADTTFDWLAYVYKVSNYPAIKVKDTLKDKVRIRICRNLGTNDTLEAKLTINKNMKASSYDRVWTDIDPQYFAQPGFRKHYNKHVGNKKNIEEWTDFIPADKTEVILPFWHCKYRNLGVPLMYFGESDRATYSFKFVTNIANLLQMQLKKKLIGKDEEGKDVTKGEVWVDVPVNFKYIEGVTATTILPMPEIWGRYYIMDPTEKAQFKDLNPNMAKLFTNPEDEDDEEVTHSPFESYDMFTDDVVICDATSEKGYGETVEIPLTTKDIVKAIFVVAENVKSRVNRNLSNYTTDCHSIKSGYNPIKRISFVHSGDTKVDLDSEHFEAIEPFKHFPSAPEFPGYHAIALCPTVLSLPESGIVLEGKNAKIMVTLGNNDPHLVPLMTGTVEDTDDDFNDIQEFKDEKKSPQGNEKFIVRVRLLVQKQIQISSVGENKYKFSCSV